MKKTIITILFISTLKASIIYPLSKTEFDLNGKLINLKNKDFIYVYINKNGIGNFYAVDKDGTTWKTGRVTGGAYGYRTSYGIFSIFQKKEKHMSTKYPDPRGINNMNYMMRITKGGIALHEGSVENLSHGCIHVHYKDVPIIYKWSKYGTKVIVSPIDYKNKAIDDLRKIYGIKRYKYIK